MTKNIYIYLLLGFLYTSDFIPDNNSTLNYIQVFFKWPQIENIEYYLVNIYNNENVYQFNSPYNSILIEDSFDWNNEYSWSVCGIDNFNNPIFCHDSNFFSTNPLPGYYPDSNEILVLEDGYYDGITIVDFDSKGFSAAINKTGYPIWFVDKYLFGNFPPKIIVTQLLNSGNFIGLGTGVGYEFDINGDIVFQTPSDYGVHHHFIKSNSTYFLIDARHELHPCPENCPDNLPEDIYWQGDQFIQINNNGELIWEWDTFDYIDLIDYNPLYLDRLSNDYQSGDALDWTHSNSIFYDNQNVFVSIRNLSRIAKINYDTKNLVWHLGNENFMNQIYFNNNIEFSGQHSVQILDNNNILFFDNHSFLDPEISRCIEFSYDEINDSVNVVWEYILPDSLYTGSRGECDRLNNGNTLINVGRTGNLIEVNDNDEIVWHLNMIDNNTEMPSYRSSRVENLYPLAFSFELNDLHGNYINQDYHISYLDTLSGYIYNQGWEDQSYSYMLLDQNEVNMYNDTLNVNANSSEQFLISLAELEIINDYEYTIRITPISNNALYQEVVFSISNIGDINNDGIINILDAIELVNFILNSEYHSIADINSDNALDVLDIILIINIILG